MARNPSNFVVGDDKEQAVGRPRAASNPIRAWARLGRTLSVARYIRQAREAEKKLARQLSFTRGILDSVGHGLYAVDRDGHATFANATAGRLLGYDAADFLGKDVHMLIHYQHADGCAFPRTACPLLSVLDNGVPVHIDDDVFTTRDGTLLEVRYVSAPIVEAGQIIGAVVAFEPIGQKKADERSLREAKEALIRYSAELEARVGQRTSELNELNARLRASNRELEDFASVASHDLQEPLRKIQTFGDRLAITSGEKLGAEGLDYLHRMKNAASRMQTLINDLLAFSRVTRRPHAMEPVDLVRIVADVLVDLEAAIEEAGATVRVDALPGIDGAPTLLRQLFQNLLGNAIKFRRPDVAPVIAVHARRIENASSDDPARREMLEILIEDNGIGFDEKYLDRIFNVFQRLHARHVYPGTGIGLAVSRKIVELHGGSITARSRVEEGSTFVVMLPVHHDSEAVARVNSIHEETNAS